MAKPNLAVPPTLASPVRQALEAEGISSLKQLTRYTERDLLSMHGIGPKGIRQMREALAEHGLHLAGEGQGR